MKSVGKFRYIISSHRPSPALAVAFLALLVALSGTAYAVATINGADIQNRSIAGKKLKKNTATGAEVKESTLGRVSSAKDIPNLKFRNLTLKNGWTGHCFGDGTPGIARSAEGRGALPWRYV